MHVPTDAELERVHAASWRDIPCPLPIESGDTLRMLLAIRRLRLEGESLEQLVFRHVAAMSDSEHEFAGELRQITDHYVGQITDQTIRACWAYWDTHEM